ncbi:hypothetical protein ACLOJK_017053 [Asimina triloba]
MHVTTTTEVKTKRARPIQLSSGPGMGAIKPFVFQVRIHSSARRPRLLLRHRTARVMSRSTASRPGWLLLSLVLVAFSSAAVVAGDRVRNAIAGEKEAPRKLLENGLGRTPPMG